MLPPLFFSVRVPTLLALFWRAHFSRPAVSGIARKGRLSFIVFRLDSLGDVVMTTPLFRALKQANPRSHCTVVVERSYKSLLATNSRIDEILTLPKIRPAWLPQRMRRLMAAVLFYWTHLRKRHFDIAISPRWDVDGHLATFLCVLANAANRVGYSEKASPAKQRINRGFDRAYHTCLPPGPVQHEVLRNLAIAEALGATACESRLEIRVTEQDRKRAQRLLGKAPRSATLIAIGIGAQSPGRRWPLERYAATVAHLDRLHSVWPVILCSGAELGEALKLAGLLPRPPVIVSGAKLRDVCAVLERCELFIGNDSGCAHLAAAMGCKTVVVSRHPRGGDANHFNSPVRFAPLGSDVHVLQPDAGLDGCKDACRSPGVHCIRQLAVEEVVTAAHAMLNQPRAEAAASLVATRLDMASQSLLQAHAAEALQAAVDALNAGSSRPIA